MKKGNNSEKAPKKVKYTAFFAKVQFEFGYWESMIFRVAYRLWVLYGPIKTPWWKNLQGCFRQKKEHEEKLAREEEDRQRNKEIWERVKRELQEDEQEAAKNWKDTEVCAMLA